MFVTAAPLPKPFEPLPSDTAQLVTAYAAVPAKTAPAVTASSRVILFLVHAAVAPVRRLTTVAIRCSPLRGATWRTSKGQMPAAVSAPSLSRHLPIPSG